jgi:hypothetical protein
MNRECADRYQVPNGHYGPILSKWQAVIPAMKPRRDEGEHMAVERNGDY